jgi:hypothetical protein
MALTMSFIIKNSYHTTEVFLVNNKPKGLHYCCVCTSIFKINHLGFVELCIVQIFCQI